MFEQWRRTSQILKCVDYISGGKVKDMLRNRTVQSYRVSCQETASEGKEGILNMNRSTGAAITTACISAAVGTAAYMAVNHSRGSSARAKKLKKTTGRALRQVGDFIDNMSYMMR